ncbi:hypothetical protein U2F26_03260 [Micromonospora sp. 4G57]|uniref:Minor tail protein n=1 Tax=Micromonospora sicca TaxID=2202420 RepID=A0ABU5JCP0_9ACTN|nr:MULTISPECIES: hypothetical protein [unclassified Micromonospora]MDZ5441750.1 hypothetical protein [Micromonospora sp. 4G57]MDZ5490311.1 hypothetical protein [Micromonospora sp. 4G53]
MRGDDLVTLFSAPPAAGIGYRQGVVVEWNPDTAENVIDIAGAQLENLSILNTSESLLLAPGDVVGVLTAGASWCILGRLTIPGTPQAAATIGAGLKAAAVIGNTSISSANYALNGGPTVTTNILRTGRAYVSFASGMDLDVGEAVALVVVATGPGGVTWSSSTVLSGSNLLTVSSGTLGGTLSLGGSTGELAAGLVPGSWTFELHSRKNAGTGNPAVYDRNLSVMPL